MARAGRRKRSPGHLSRSRERGNDVFARVPEHFDEFEAQQDAVIDAGEHLVVVGAFRARSKADHEMHAPYAHVWRMRDGKAASFHNHVEAAPWAEGWTAS